MVGFFADGKFNKISVEGGAVVPLTAANGSAGATRGQDGSIILGGSFNAGLTGSSGGGAPTKVTDPADGEITQGNPRVLPEGKRCCLQPTRRCPRKRRIRRDHFGGRAQKDAGARGNFPLYLATSPGAGHLVYANKGTLFAIPVDPERLETHGTAVPILDDVAYNPAVGAAQFDVAGNGTLVYRRSSAAASPGMVTLQWLDATGRKEPLQAKAGAYSDPQLSPDGKRVAMQVTEESGQDIWIYDPQRDTMTRLTSGGGTYVYGLEPGWPIRLHRFRRQRDLPDARRRRRPNRSRLPKSRVSSFRGPSHPTANAWHISKFLLRSGRFRWRRPTAR